MTTFYVTHVRLTPSAGSFTEATLDVFEVDAPNATVAMKRTRKFAQPAHTTEYLRCSRVHPVGFEGLVVCVPEK